jgi:hypothetical protein
MPAADDARARASQNAAKAAWLRARADAKAAASSAGPLRFRGIAPADLIFSNTVHFSLYTGAVHE